MGPNLENLDAYMSADEILEYIDRFNSDDDLTAIKGAFLTMVGREAFTLLKPLVYPKTLRDAAKQWRTSHFLRKVVYTTFGRRQYKSL